MHKSIINIADVELVPRPSEHAPKGESTRISPEVCEYPDSSKFGVYGEFQHDDPAQKKLFRFVSREQHSVDYWDGE